MIGRIGNGPKVIAFDGHIDTVDLGNLENWLKWTIGYSGNPENWLLRKS